MSTNHIFDPNIIKIFKDKQYLIILQGTRGSGKTFFASELKKKYPNIEICSSDDYFNQLNTEYCKNNVADAYRFCKQKTLSFLEKGKTVIYNNTNLNDSQLDDIITNTKSKKICCIILRFFPTWDEEKCVNFAKIFHPITQQHITKQNIIRDNINLIHFQNKHKLGCFGIQSYLNQDLILFKHFPSKIDDLKQKYLQAGYINIIKEKQKPPKTSKHQIMQTTQNPPFFELPPSVKIEQRNLEIKVDHLQKQVENLQEKLEALSFSISESENICEKRLFRFAKRPRNQDDE